MSGALCYRRARGQRAAGSRVVENLLFLAVLYPMAGMITYLDDPWHQLSWLLPV